MICPKCKRNDVFRVNVEAELEGKLFREDDEGNISYKQESTWSMKYVRVYCQCGRDGTPEEFGIDVDKISS